MCMHFNIKIKKHETAFKSNKFKDNALDGRSKFNLKKDILVYIHIQKTGGMDFETLIYNNLMVNYSNEWIQCCQTRYKSFVVCMGSASMKRYVPIYYDRYTNLDCDVSLCQK